MENDGSNTAIHVYFNSSQSMENDGSNTAFYVYFNSSQSMENGESNTAFYVYSTPGSPCKMVGLTLLSTST